MIAGDYKDEVFAGDDFGGHQEVSKDSYNLMKGHSSIKDELQEKYQSRFNTKLNIALIVILGVIMFIELYMHF